jgi:hypothetical protein
MVSDSAEGSADSPRRSRSGVPVMARYRKLDVRTWTDKKFRELSPMVPSGQGLWLYLILGPQTSNIPGLFEASQVDMADRLEWTLEDFRRCWSEIEAKGMAKADWRARLVWLPRATEYNRPESPNVVVSWANIFDELPECDLKDEAYQTLKAFAKDMGESFHHAFSRAFHKVFPEALPKDLPESVTQTITITNQDTSNPSTGVEGVNGKKPEPVVAVFQHWQTVHNHPTAKLDAKRRKLIGDRLKEGFTVDELKQSITGYLHSPFHMGENEHKKVFDSIELILRNTEKVEAGIDFDKRASGKAPTNKPAPRFT